MWEISEQLHNEEAWGKWLELPSSVTRFCIDIESIERRKDEVDYIAGETVDQWRFQRANSTNMVAAKAHTTVPDTWVVPCLADGAGCVMKWRLISSAPVLFYDGWRPSQEPLDDRRHLNPPPESIGAVHYLET
ncbi:hypothetical protein PDIDSM_8381 [Penicillium digitatum]|nr:hypothetical protein PDIDSM_8381 [Penicillium digitatum]